MKIAFIGAGAINFGVVGSPWNHSLRIEALRGLSDISVIAIVDPMVDKAKEVLVTKLKCKNGDMYKDCQILPNLDLLLSMEPKPDAVFLGTPPHTRGSFNKDVELKLVKAGIHIFCEKPLTALSPEEFRPYSEAVTQAALKNDVIISVGYMFRYHSAILKMKEAIQAHGGKIMSLEARYYFAYSTTDHAYWWDVSKSGGPIIEQATHFCDLARFLAGDVDLSTIITTCLREEDKGGAGILSGIPDHCEQGLKPENKAPRVTMSHWRFQQGGLGSLIHTIALYGTKYETSIDVQMDGLRITLLEPYTSECTVRIRDKSSETATTYSFGDDNPYNYPSYGECDPYKEEIQRFIEGVVNKDNSKIASSYADATKTLDMTWAIRRAEKN